MGGPRRRVASDRVGFSRADSRRGLFHGPRFQAAALKISGGLVALAGAYLLLNPVGFDPLGYVAGAIGVLSGLFAMWAA